MTRRPALVLVPVAALVLLAGCGDVADEPRAAGGEPPPATGPPATGVAETGGTASATTSAEPSPEPPQIAPPPIVLESEAGRQQAVQESYCVQKIDEAGVGTGVCSDTPQRDPKRLTVVRPGDLVTISMRGGRLVEEPEGCVPDCPPTVTVAPLGCRGQSVETFLLAAEGTRWTVDLPPGAYELSIFSHFESSDGLSGDTSGVLGLLVDPDRRPAIGRATRDLFVCP